jgi:16S rRNA (guanine527-N7)-methyltransferase
MDLLLERNAATNLTSIRDPAVAWEKLILGSLVAMEAHQFQGRERVADVGSGGGLPGIPLKLALPELQVCLVESDQRKAAFLRDVVTRAAAKAPGAAEYCLPLVRPGGTLLAMAQYKDWDAARRAVGQLGGRLDGERAGVVIVRKVRETPDQFPRRVGIPGKRPL